MNEFMKAASELAAENLTANSGGPFGAVVVKDGKIIADEECEELKNSAYLIEGSADDVNGYAEGRDVLSKSTTGTIASMCIKGKPENVPETITVSRPSLQQLIISLTGGGSYA